MDVGRFFYKQDNSKSIFYYKDIFIKPQDKIMPMGRYPIKLIVTDKEIIIDFNELIIENTANNLSISTKQFHALSIPYFYHTIKKAFCSYISLKQGHKM